MPISYVGGQVGTFAGTTSLQTINFALTNGTDATPIAGDFVVVTLAAGSTVSRALTIKNIQFGTDYTLASGAQLYSDDSFDCNGRVGYRFMPNPPETSVAFTTGSGNTADAGAWTIHVFRDVDPVSPMDVAEVVATGINTRIPNPGAITPVTSGAVILVIAAAASATGGTYTAGYLTDFRAATQADNNDVNIGSGYLLWDGLGPYDPAAFGGGGTDTTADAWVAMTMALRPTTVTAVLTGTAVGGITEADIVAGGKTIVITLTNNTWTAN